MKNVKYVFYNIFFHIFAPESRRFAPVIGVYYMFNNTKN